MTSAIDTEKCCQYRPYLVPECVHLDPFVCQLVGHLLLREALALVLWAGGRVAEAIPVAVDVCALNAGQAALGLARISAKKGGPTEFDTENCVTICRAKFVAFCKSSLTPVVISVSPKTTCSAALPPNIIIIRANSSAREIKF